MSRTEAIIKRITDQLTQEGVIKKDIYAGSPTGYGDFTSFFDLLVELKLEGRETITAQEIWENMKQQKNYLERAAATAAEEYRKLENKYRGLKSDYEELIRESKN